jgi:hypothetical protein
MQKREISFSDESSDYVTIEQTRGGDYSSMPNVDHILQVLNATEDQWGKGDWENEAASRGHGEYINNVYKVAAYCKQHGISTKHDIGQLLDRKTKIVEA